MKQLVKGITVFQLGNVHFRVSNCDAAFEQHLNKLLPLSLRNPAAGSGIEDIKTGCSRDVGDLIRAMPLRHAGCICIGANSLVSPTGQRLLLAGGLGVGRSTVSMVLAGAFGWKMLSQPYVLLERNSPLVIPFKAPLSFSDEAFEYLQQTIPEHTSELESFDWSPKRTTRWAKPANEVVGQQTAEFDQAVIVEESDEISHAEIISLSLGEFIRKLLPISNLLSLPRAADEVASYLCDTECILVRGNFQQRVTATIAAATKGGLRLKASGNTVTGLTAAAIEGGKTEPFSFACDGP